MRKSKYKHLVATKVFKKDYDYNLKSLEGLLQSGLIDEVVLNCAVNMMNEDLENERIIDTTVGYLNLARYQEGR